MLFLKHSGNAMLIKMRGLDNTHNTQRRINIEEETRQLQDEQQMIQFPHIHFNSFNFLQSILNR